VEQLRNLPRGHARISSPLPLVCISHTWHGREHPDPYGDNLLEFAKAVVEARKVERFPKGDFAVFWDWMSLHQHPGFGKKRKGAEEVAFQRALSHMSLWYAHMKTLVYLLTATPAAWPSNTLPYSSRGWPSFERMITMLLKHQSSKCWATICDVGAFAEGGAQRTRLEPPKAPEDFAQMLSRLHFTNGTDQAKVLMLYRETLNCALGQARSLRYTGLRWGDPEMAALAKVLPLCRNLVYLNLKGSHNEYTEASASVLADLLSHHDVAPHLQMIGAGCRDKALDTDDQGPLLESSRLHAVCKSRGLKLLRDVPLELVDQLQKQRGSQHKELSRDSSASHSRDGSQRTRARRRSSVQMSMKSIFAALPGALMRSPTESSADGRRSYGWASQFSVG